MLCNLKYRIFYNELCNYYLQLDCDEVCGCHEILFQNLWKLFASLKSKLVNSILFSNLFKKIMIVPVFLY